MPIRDNAGTLREKDSLDYRRAGDFDPGVRDQVCRWQGDAAEWLDRAIAPGINGGRSTCHDALRHIETLVTAPITCASCGNCKTRPGRFTGFVPFAFEPSNPLILAH